MTIGSVDVWLERRSLAGWRVLALAVGLLVLGAQLAFARQDGGLMATALPAWGSMVMVIVSSTGAGFAVYGAFRIRIGHLERDVRDLQVSKAEKLAVLATSDRILGLQDEGRRLFDDVRRELSYIRDRVDALHDQRGGSSR